jgi:hypothetical protein
MVTPSSRRPCHHPPHLLCRCRRLRLPLGLHLPRLALVEGGHWQPPTDQEGLSRGILDIFCSCPNGTPRYTLANAGILDSRREKLLERKRDPKEG